MNNERLPANVGSNDELGVAVLVDGAVVAWFSEMDEYAEDFCRENWFGRWLTWRAKRPEIVLMTAEEQAKCQAAALEIHSVLRADSD